MVKIQKDLHKAAATAPLGVKNGSQNGHARLVQSESLRQTELHPPTDGLGKGDRAENATAAVVMTNARKNIHIERFIL